MYLYLMFIGANKYGRVWFRVLHLKIHWIGPNPLSSVCSDSTFTHSYLCLFSALFHFFSFPAYFKCWSFYCCSCGSSFLPRLRESSPGLSPRARFIFIYVFSRSFFQSAPSQFTAQPLDKAAVINLPHRLFSALRTLALCHSHSFAISWALFMKQINMRGHSSHNRFMAIILQLLAPSPKPHFLFS